jgi:hypothetical protein
MNFNNLEVQKFKERFCSFYDSIIRAVTVEFRNVKSVAKVTVTLSARDLETDSNDNWVNVTIKVSGVSELAFYESPKESYQVLSNGLHILNFENLMCFDFGYHIDEPNNIAEFRESKFYVIGEEFEWIISNYTA